MSADGKKAICRRKDDGTGVHRRDKSGQDYWLYELNGHRELILSEDSGRRSRGSLEVHLFEVHLFEFHKLWGPGPGSQVHVPLHDELGKGIDNLLASGHEPTLLVGEDAHAAVNEIVAEATWVWRILKNAVSATELLAIEFPEPRWIVPGIIPEGTTILVGGDQWRACLSERTFSK